MLRTSISNTLTKPDLNKSGSLSNLKLARISEKEKLSATHSTPPSVDTSTTTARVGSPVLGAKPAREKRSDHLQRKRTQSNEIGNQSPHLEESVVYDEFNEVIKFHGHNIGFKSLSQVLRKGQLLFGAWALSMFCLWLFADVDYSAALFQRYTHLPTIYGIRRTILRSVSHVVGAGAVAFAFATGLDLLAFYYAVTDEKVYLYSKSHLLHCCVESFVDDSGLC